MRKIRKNVFLILISVILLLSVVLGAISLRNMKKKTSPLDYNRSRQVFGTASEERSVLSRGIAQELCVGKDNTSLEGIHGSEGEASGLFDIRRKEIPYSRNLYERISPGKITQLMTVLTASEALEQEETVVIEAEDVVQKYSGTTSGLSVGNEISVKQLVNAVLVYSAEDACLALARAAAGDRDSFVEQMNRKAQELGMTNTRFSNVTGSAEEEQYTTVYDSYLLLHQMLQNQDLINAMGLSGYTMNCTKSNGDLKQTRLDSDNPYLTGILDVPKDVTVLGGKYTASSSENATFLLVQNYYGDVFVLIVSGADGEGTMNTRMREMLNKVNS